MTMLALFNGTEGASISHKLGATQTFLVQLVSTSGFPVPLNAQDTVEALFYTSAARAGTPTKTVSCVVHPALGAYGYVEFTLAANEATLTQQTYFVWVKLVTSNVVNAVTVTANGTGYTTTPNVEFVHTTGVGARATAYVSNGISIAITNGGTGYTTATLVIDEPEYGGVKAVATATLGGGVITGINLTERGFGYVTAPGIDVVGDGSGAVLTASLTGRVRHIAVTSGGGQFATAPTVNIVGGGGSGATATATVSATGPTSISRTASAVVVQ